MILLTYLVTVFGLIGLFIWIIIYLFILHQEKGERLIGWLASLISWAGKGAEKTATGMSIQGKIDSFLDSINTEVDGLLPYKLKIKWISPNVDKETFIAKKQVVVMLDYHPNKDENLSKATLLYMNKAVIPECRPHIDKKLGRAIDMMMTKKALYSFIEARSAFGHFINSVLRPEIEKDKEIKDFCQTIDSIDERGLFTRVLLRELLELGRTKGAITETGDTVFETNNFTNFLNEIAQKESGEDVPLTFSGHDIKIAVILVARSGVDSSTTFQFIKRIKDNIKKSINVIYIFARGKGHHIDLAREVVNECKNIPELFKVHEEEFPTRLTTGESINGYCTIFYNRKVV